MEWFERLPYQQITKNESMKTPRKTIKLGSILSITVPEKANCINDAVNDRIDIACDDWRTPIGLHIFHLDTPGCADWCKAALESHVRDVIGPPYKTSVDQVMGNNWTGYQGVTALSDTLFLINRVIASKVSGYGLRLEFEMSKEKLSESLMEALESITF